MNLGLILEQDVVFLLRVAVSFEVDFKLVGRLNRFLSLFTDRSRQAIVFGHVHYVLEVELISLLALQSEISSAGGFSNDMGELLSGLRTKHGCFPPVFRSYYVTVKFVDC